MFNFRFIRSLIFFLLILFQISSEAQIVSISPSGGGAEDEITLTFDASKGNAELAGESTVYFHHGVVLSGPDGEDWNYVVGNWGQDDGIGEMTKVSGTDDQWEIVFSPTLRTYFGASSSEEIFRISGVFRSADGSTKGTLAQGDYGWGEVASNGDFFINLKNENYISLSNPTGDFQFVNVGETIAIEANSSSSVSNMAIWIDEGSGFEKKKEITSSTAIDYNYTVNNSLLLKIRITATIQGEDLEILKDYQLIVKQQTQTQALPSGVIPGINYQDDPTKVVLALIAPDKEFVHVLGDFNNWKIDENYQMKRTPDGEIYWLEINDLEPGKPYVFQYWIDGDIKIGDPFADQVADPWNDEYIESDVFPNIPAYPFKNYSLATVLETDQVDYQWNASENTWNRPDIDQLVIYELHIRDFLSSHNYQDLTDTLPYLKKLGIEAIELMPISEFEGNDSWGYNPSYFLATDKYYGTKDDLKAFIEAAHQEGMAVILDMVLNHAFGQNPMVRMYFDYATGKPASNNPWFNREYVGPYQWGYDFNHESQYTKDFIDRVNKYWIEEFHFDGFRFDFTKGFTNSSPGGSIDGFDQSRIDILKRMADEIWKVDPDTYIILEHWGPGSEEKVLSDYGMKMWRNKSYDFVPATIGASGNSFNNHDVKTHVSFFDSHDERRIAEHCLTEGLSNGGYDIKDPALMMERVKLAAAFHLLMPGPKMIWQFDELAYDIDINFNGRVGRKPIPWGASGNGYYDDPLRQHVYTTYAALIALRQHIGAENLTTALTKHNLSGFSKRLVFNTDDTDLIVVGNFDLTSVDIEPSFTQLGTWYDYFSGEEIEVTTQDQLINLQAGEWRIFTSEKIGNGFPGAVEVYENPVSFSPKKFSINDIVTLTFDAKKASTFGTEGLVGAQKVYFHSGVITDDPNSTDWKNIVGNLTDDGVGEMTSVGNDIWQLTFKPSDYYGVNDESNVFKLAMYFRDATNENIGKGFRDQDIYYKVEEDGPFIEVTPSPYQTTDLINIRFNARKGNGELIGASKVYMHSSIGTVDTDNPAASAWNNAIGNWGEDDGVGQMSLVPGTTDIWEINVTPKTYYGLSDSDQAFWLACVFRNADGSVKGTGAPGDIIGGFIDSNLDFFIKNADPNNVVADQLTGFTVYPNPASNYLRVEGEGTFEINIYNMSGYLVAHHNGDSALEIDIDYLYEGAYTYRIFQDGKLKTGKFIKLN